MVALNLPVIWARHLRESLGAVTVAGAAATAASWLTSAGSVTVGLLITMIAIGSLWAYLSSIAIDEGLEGLIFLPILAVASAIVALGARSWTGRFRPILASVAACVGIAVAATVHAWSRAEGPPVFPVYAGTVLLFLPLTVVGVAIGTAIGDSVRHVRSNRGLTLPSTDG